MALAGDAAAVAAAVFTGGGLAYASTQIRLARQHSRSARTYEYFNRFMNWEFGQRMSRAREFCKSDSSALRDRKWKRWRAFFDGDYAFPLPPVDEWRELVNFFVELGASLRHGQLDERLAAQMFRAISWNFYSEVSWLLQRVNDASPLDEGGFFGSEWWEMNERFAGRPRIRGAAMQGSTLVFDCGGIPTVGVGPLRYQWYNEDAPIAGAVRHEYRLTQRDVGRRISCTARRAHAWGPQSDELVARLRALPAAHIHRQLKPGEVLEYVIAVPNRSVQLRASSASRLGTAVIEVDDPSGSTYKHTNTPQGGIDFHQDGRWVTVAAPQPGEWLVRVLPPQTTPTGDVNVSMEARVVGASTWADATDEIAVVAQVVTP